jgi:tetratricopeptide (TPR) repeat protein
MVMSAPGAKLAPEPGSKIAPKPGLLLLCAVGLAAGLAACSKRHGGTGGTGEAPQGMRRDSPDGRTDATAEPPSARRGAGHPARRGAAHAVRPLDPEDRVAARVLLFTASWCPTCHQLEQEVLHEEVGRRLLSGAELRTVDFDAPASQALVMKHLITGLPTTVFLREEGSEIDRIVGFEGRREYLEEARAILAGRDGLHLIRDQLRRRPQDLELRYEAGYRLLLRGKEQAAQKHYDHILRKDPTDRTGLASKVMLHRGRYLVRCKRDYPAAVRLLRRAVSLYGDGRAGKGLRYWLGWALCKAGKPGAAARSLDAHVKEKGRSAESLALAAGLRRRCGHELEEALAMAREAVDKAPNNDWAWYLVADLSHRLGKPDRARKAIAKAASLAPDRAFYRHEKARITGDQN